VAVIVRAPFTPEEFASVGAVGEFVAGAGPIVGRESALAALETGKVRNSLLGGKPSGRRLIRVSNRPRAITIYVSLPPLGRHRNSQRYPIAVVGGGYRGLLTSSSTRIRGLVAIADIAPTAVALEDGRRPRIRFDADADGPATVARLEHRIHEVRSVRWPAALLMIGVSVLWGFTALGTRSPLAGRATVLAAPAALGTSLLLSGAGVTNPWVVAAVLAAAVVVGAPVAASLTGRPVAFASALASLLVVYLVVLAAWPEVNAISAYGPHPDGGGRFYGIPNRVETILLLPALLPASILGLVAALPLAALALVTVGLSVTGADGGGLFVVAAGFLALGPRLRGGALTTKRVAVAAAGALVVALGLVAIDAAFGGSSHVTRAVGGGPGDLAGDFVRRLHLSFESATSSWDQGLFLLIGLAVMTLPAFGRPRSPVRDALFVAIAVSLLVNDAPIDALGYGAMITTALWTWERLRPAGARLLE
jgi:hypothetical protein